MSVIKCGNGHFYDGEKYKECPHCIGQSEKDTGDKEEKTRYLSKEDHSKRNLAQKQLQEFALGQGKRDERTVGFYRTQKGGNPITGWLVCVNGAEWGRDFRIFSGKNKIGRALNMDIVLADDPAVSRENHCALIFEPRRVQYILQKGTGDQVTVDGVPLGEMAVLKGEERIVIGNSTFVFIPFCKEGRMW